MKLRISMRWWLATVFAVIAALSASLTAFVAPRQANHDLEAHARSVAIGDSVVAAVAAQRAARAGRLASRLPNIAESKQLSIFIFDTKGRLIASSTLHGAKWKNVPHHEAALSTALADHRYVAPASSDDHSVVGLPMHRIPNRNPVAGALVSYSAQPLGLQTPVAIFRTDVLETAGWAILVAALTGLVAAVLIARRLGRIANAAAAIEQGDFAIELNPRFMDEIGSLALTTDRMRRRLSGAFQRLSDERDRLGLLLERLQDGVVAVNGRLEIEFVNERSREIAHPTPLEPGSDLPDEIIGLRIREIAEQLFAPNAQVSESRVDTRGDAIFDVVGIPAAASGLAVLVFSDVSEDERRRKAEREFVANASHEFRTPVAAIGAAVEALRSGAQDSPASRERFLALIQRQNDRLTRLTKSLLILARAETREEEIALEPIELGPILQQAVKSADPVPGVKLVVENGATVVALGEQALVEQIVANLVGNAVKNTSSGEIRLSASKRGATALIQVVDSGRGIPVQEQDRVFDRFYSGDPARRDGFGLGLAIARDAARALGGDISIDSEPGHGTTVRVSLQLDGSR